CVGVSGQWLTSWSGDQFTATVRARRTQSAGAAGTESALVATNERTGVEGQRRAAALAKRPHLKQGEPRRPGHCLVVGGCPSSCPVYHARGPGAGEGRRRLELCAQDPGDALVTRDSSGGLYPGADL